MTICAYTLHQTTIVSNQTSHSPATGVDECAEVPDGKVPGGNLEASPDIIPFTFFTVSFLVATTYISLDVALTITKMFGPSNPLAALHSVPLFVLTSIWPAAATLIFFFVMVYVVLGLLRKLDYFLLSKVICNGSNMKVDGSFIAMLLETLAVAVIYLAWCSITEDAWEDGAYYP
ncbi:hypothetical protein M422DRAFT_269009 [Sphaerobolus stellatus SS14]|uniref:Uncharacterized protein n=1 Tax=Sphaerobolus stellatus (strain SS14) TaxID=990650 RepID=A0A0C9TIZ0_SPHS4|nr:hypothetical protein M422DRAFT_269009 [Sphaerobolus stellatus SS14]